MSPIKFPDEDLIRTLSANGKLDEALQMFANVLVADPTASWVPDFCRDWLHCTDSKVLAHKALRKAVYHISLTRRALLNSSVETYWDLVCRFGPTNQTATVDYLNVAPKSVPLKLGRLLLTKAEFGVKPMTLVDLQRVLAVLFASPAIAQGVITHDWLKELARIRSSEAELIAKMGKAYAIDGPVYSLVTLFPQLGTNKAHLLLSKTGESVEQLTQKMLDVPDFVSKTLESSKEQDSKPKKYVVLDDEEKERRANAQRQKRRLEFSYKYTAFEEEDPDPEAEDTVQPELSEADKKLIAQEELLWAYWHNNKEVFDRQSRKSDARKTLKAKLKWTDEQIEGWGRVSAKSNNSSKDSVNLPKHMREVEAYAPALRQDSFDVNGSGSTANNDHSKSAQKPQDRPKKEGRKEGGKQATSRQGSAKPEGKGQKPSQQKPTQQKSAQQKAPQKKSSEHKPAQNNKHARGRPSKDQNSGPD